jgi:pimeloyl-ACP methyl ester carboxylesterase
MTLERLVIHGQEIAFRTAGEGPVVVLLHGMAGSSETWRQVLPALARDYTVVAPDLLGHGSSAKPHTEYSVSAHANVIRDLMAALGHESATLIGQSFGGGVAMQLAYQYPDRCARMVLVSSGGLGREVSALLRTLSVPGAEHVLALACGAPLRDGANALTRWLGKAGLHPSPVLQEILRSWDTLGHRDARRAFFCTLRGVIDQRGQAVCASDRLYLAAHVPTLIVWGEKDSLIPVAHATAAHAAMPGSRLEIFPGVGHFPHNEAPERFVEVLVDFMRSTEPVRLSEALLRESLRAEPSRRSAP